jgi:hypothetical protein
VIVEKTISECNKLRERLMKIRRKKRDGVIILLACCFVAGIVMSQFLIIGFSFWMSIGVIFTVALIIHYGTIEAEVVHKMENLGNC